MAEKIATCCYCSATTVLSLRGTTRHELACASCGAPLSKLKMLPVKSKTSAKKGTVQRENAPKKSKKKRSTSRWILKEAFDIIEDIFD